MRKTFNCWNQMFLHRDTRISCSGMARMSILLQALKWPIEVNIHDDDTEAIDITDMLIFLGYTSRSNGSVMIAHTVTIRFNEVFNIGRLFVQAKSILNLVTKFGTGE